MRRRISRRSFLKRGTLGLMGIALGGTRSAPATTGRPFARRVICLFMRGGPSQTDTFDPKPHHANGGPFRAIRTTVSGVSFSENLPRLAERAHELTLIRSMRTREETHSRARSLMRTRLLPKARRDANDGLPSAILLNSSAFDARADGIGGDVLSLPDPMKGVEGLEPVGVDAAERPSEAALAKALRLDEEPSRVRHAYGMTRFGQGCLLARRLVDVGVPWVEVTLDGWDTHQDHFSQVRRLSATLDRAMAALLDDLRRRDLLDSTLVLWMGEFGRSPRINDRDGRDHWSNGWTVALAGGGLPGGRVLGGTDASGERIVGRPVSAEQFFAFLSGLLHVDATTASPFPIV